MPKEKATHHYNNRATKRSSAQPTITDSNERTSQTNPIPNNPINLHRASAQNILQLQRLLGNRAVGNLLGKTIQRQIVKEKDETTQRSDNTTTTSENRAVDMSITPASTESIQRVVLFYWDPNNHSWGAYENEFEEPQGYYIQQNQPMPFDWDRWMNDQTYYQWFQDQLGGPPPEYQQDQHDQDAPAQEQAQDAQAQDQAMAQAQNAPAQNQVQEQVQAPQPQVQYGQPQDVGGGYREIQATIGQTVVGRVRFATAESDVPGSNGQQRGIELSQISIEEEHRGRGIATPLLDRALQAIGYDRTVWLDAVAQGGLSQGQLQNWYGRHGFQATGNGNIMVAASIM